MLCAFDLIELDGKNLRRTPIEERKYALANLLYRDHDGIAFNKHYDCDGAVVYKHVCALGCWLKIKNPAAPGVLPPSSPAVSAACWPWPSRRGASPA